MDDRDMRENPFECVEPELGDQLWKRALPDLEPELRARLDDHLIVCDACRLTLAVEERTVRGLRSGTLRLEQPARRRWRRTLEGFSRSPRAGWLACGGSLAVAASLVLILLVPPSPPRGGDLRRAAAAGSRFERPVEDEVVLSDRPGLAWSEIPGASGYRIEISSVGGKYAWIGQTEDTHIRVPDGSPLPGTGRYRAILYPVPADLAGPGGVTVSFTRGGLGSFLIYRVGAAPLWVRLLGLVGLAGLSFVGTARLLRRNYSSRT